MEYTVFGGSFFLQGKLMGAILVGLLVLILCLFRPTRNPDNVSTFWPLYPTSSREEILEPIKRRGRPGGMVGKWDPERAKWAQNIMDRAMAAL